MKNKESEEKFELYDDSKVRLVIVQDSNGSENTSVTD